MCRSSIKKGQEEDNKNFFEHLCSDGRGAAAASSMEETVAGRKKSLRYYRTSRKFGPVRDPKRGTSLRTVSLEKEGIELPNNSGLTTHEYIQKIAKTHERMFLVRATLTGGSGRDNRVVSKANTAARLEAAKSYLRLLVSDLAHLRWMQHQ